jgi:hypothetical protein
MSLQNQKLVLDYQVRSDDNIDLIVTSLDAETNQPTGLSSVGTSSDPSVVSITNNVMNVLSYGDFALTATQAGNLVYNPATITDDFLVIKEFFETRRPPTYVNPIKIFVGVLNNDLSSLNINIDTTLNYNNFTGTSYAMNGPSPSTVARVTITATDTLGDSLTDFSANPLIIICSVPMAASDAVLTMYKLNVAQQPSGFPKTMDNLGNNDWLVYVESLSEFDVRSRLPQIQTLTFTSPVPFSTSTISFTYSSRDFDNRVVSLPTTITSSNTDVATIEGSNINFSSPGRVVITASNEGDGDYLPASISRNLDIFVSAFAERVTNYLNSTIRVDTISYKTSVRTIYVIVDELIYARSANFSYATNTPYSGLLMNFLVETRDENNDIVANHSDEPLRIELTIPMADTLNTLKVYKRSGSTILTSQPSGFPVELSYSNGKWIGELPSLSEFSVIDASAPYGKYHYIVNLPINQEVLFSDVSYSNLSVNTDELLDIIQSTLSSFHDTQSFDDLRLNEWVGIDGTDENPDIAQVQAVGYYNNTVQEFSDPNALLLGNTLLDIIAKGTFNHRGVRAAIANDSSISSLTVQQDNQPLASLLVTQISEAFSVERPDIYDWYVATYPLRHQESAPQFDFTGLTFTFFMSLNNSFTFITRLGGVPVQPDPDEVVSEFSRLIKIDLQINV